MKKILKIFFICRLQLFYICFKLSSFTLYTVYHLTLLSIFAFLWIVICIWIIMFLLYLLILILNVLLFSESTDVIDHDHKQSMVGTLQSAWISSIINVGKRSLLTMRIMMIFGSNYWLDKLSFVECQKPKSFRSDMAFRSNY